MSKPAVSILVPTYGRVKLLEEVLESFLHQDTDEVIEIIILNDRTDQVLEYYGDRPTNRHIHVLNVSERYVSLGDKRNAMASVASGEWLVFWDDDDIPLRSNIRHHLNNVVGQGSYTADALAWMNRKILPELMQRNESVLWSLIVSKELYLAVGGCPSISCGEDFGLFSRLSGKLNSTKGVLPYIYRWPTGKPHASGFGAVKSDDDERRISSLFEQAISRELSSELNSAGVIEMIPHWDIDYEKLALDAISDIYRTKHNVYIITDWCSPDHIKNQFLRCSPGMSSEYKQIKVVDKIEDAERIVTINRVADDLDLSKVIAFTAEPTPIRNQWGNRDPDGINVRVNKSLKPFRNFDKWYINLTYDQLLESSRFIKNKRISAIISGLGYLDGHKSRLEFLALLKSNISDIDHFGRNNVDAKSELKNKEDGLAQYKYTFNCENSREDNYFTEKLVDAILCECLCFYDGCPNIEKFIDPEAYIRIDLTKPRESLWIVIGAMQAGEWERRLPAIKRAKYKLMHEDNPLSVINEAVRQSLTIDLADYKIR